MKLADDRMQEITLHNLDGDGHDISAAIIEITDGKILRSEHLGSA